MGGILYLLKQLFSHLCLGLKSRYKWLIILFIIWLYRVDFMPDEGVGFAKILQVVSIFGILFFILNNTRGLTSKIVSKSNAPIKSLVWLYIYAVISVCWAYSPTFAFFLSFQNLVMILLLFYTFCLCRTFVDMERVFLLAGISIVLFEIITYRVLVETYLFIHFLPAASSSALLFSYCIAELLAMRKSDNNRSKLLIGVLIVSLITLVTSTSSGANASAFAGFGLALLLSGKILISLLCIVFAAVMYANPDLIQSLILFIMPGKTMQSIETATGRTVMWDLILAKAAERPLIGWGFACAERSIGTQFIGVVTSDAHNNFIGIYGSLGIIGIILFVIHWIQQLFNAFRHRYKPGMLGLFCATFCALLNSYSYGFLSGKACSITIVYFSVVILSYFYCRCKNTL